MKPAPEDQLHSRQGDNAIGVIEDQPTIQECQIIASNSIKIQLLIGESCCCDVAGRCCSPRQGQGEWIGDRCHGHRGRIGDARKGTGSTRAADIYLGASRAAIAAIPGSEGEGGCAGAAFTVGAIRHIAHLAGALENQGRAGGQGAKGRPNAAAIGGVLPGAEARGPANGDAEAGAGSFLVAGSVATSPTQQIEHGHATGRGVFRDAAKGVTAGSKDWRIIDRRHVDCYGHGRRRAQAGVVDGFDLEGSKEGDAVEVGQRCRDRGVVGINQLIGVAIPGAASNR